jgi:hypothetical protein
MVENTVYSGVQHMILRRTMDWQRRNQVLDVLLPWPVPNTRARMPPPMLEAASLARRVMKQQTAEGTKVGRPCCYCCYHYHFSLFQSRQPVEPNKPKVLGPVWTSTTIMTWLELPVGARSKYCFVQQQYCGVAENSRECHRKKSSHFESRCSNP